MRSAAPRATVYGFYYNKKMFKAAGLTSPPKTMSQLTAYAKKLTKKNSDGSIKVAGYNPVPRLLPSNAPDLTTYAPLFGAKYVRRQRQVGALEAIRRGRRC